MNVDDVLYNWLQLKVVLDHRAFDESAQVSLDHVTEILHEEYNVKNVVVTKQQDSYNVVYTIDGMEKEKTFSSQMAEVLLDFIKENPQRYDFR